MEGQDGAIMRLIRNQRNWKIGGHISKKQDGFDPDDMYKELRFGVVDKDVFQTEIGQTHLPNIQNEEVMDSLFLTEIQLWMHRILQILDIMGMTIIRFLEIMVMAIMGITEIMDGYFDV